MPLVLLIKITAIQLNSSVVEPQKISAHRYAKLKNHNFQQTYLRKFFRLKKQKFPTYCLCW